ncbi:MAG: TIGR03808 family TAT-translocated repetitive protein [Devosia sp.]
MSQNRLSRRGVLTGFVAASAAIALPRPAFAHDTLDAGELGLLPYSRDDQSTTLQAAIDKARLEQKSLFLPAGMYLANNVVIPAGFGLTGSQASTTLSAFGDGPVLKSDGHSAFLIEDIGFSGLPGKATADGSGLLELFGATGFTINRCRFREAGGNGIGLFEAQGTISDCDFLDLGDAAIHSMASGGLQIFGNRIIRCGNAGVRIFRDSSRSEKTIITGNRIEAIDWKGGGNGQTGNGINLFKADGVIVADNFIENCAFTAVRANSCNDVVIRGNYCGSSGEVAIFSEFAFSGSVVADNIIDGAATGISITNLDDGGHLATCTGNIVRNIAERSEVNPDTKPVGIYVEAETSVVGNSIESVPGIGIMAGYGKFVRNVVISSNVLSQVQTGIGVSVVQDAESGPVLVNGNLIGKPEQHGIVGMEWDKIVSDDLVRDAGRYPNVTLSGNVDA